MPVPCSQCGSQVRKAIEQGQLDVAKVYASNAIREKNQGLNYLKLASKLDSVAAKLKQVGMGCRVLRCVALRCVALRCVALRCVALRCVSFRFVSLRCLALSCLALRIDLGLMSRISPCIVVALGPSNAKNNATDGEGDPEFRVRDEKYGHNENGGHDGEVRNVAGGL